MKFIYGTILLTCLCHALIAAPVASTNDDDDQQRLDDIAAELKQLQKEFSVLQNVNKAVSNQNEIAANVPKQPAQQKPILTTGGDDKTKVMEPRGVGWQPLKRLAEDSNNPTFQLALKDQTSLKQQIINAVEDHLLEDLQSAQQYGIEPQQILADLRQKNKGNQKE